MSLLESGICAPVVSCVCACRAGSAPFLSENNTHPARPVLDEVVSWVVPVKCEESRAESRSSRRARNTLLSVSRETRRSERRRSFVVKPVAPGPPTDRDLGDHAHAPELIGSRAQLPERSRGPTSAGPDRPDPNTTDLPGDQTHPNTRDPPEIRPTSTQAMPPRSAS